MQCIAEVLEQTLKKMGLTKRYRAELAIDRWPEIVGEDIATHACPVRMEGGVLFISVSSSVWSHHLFMLKESIIYKINQFVGEKIVKDIRFQAGYLKYCKNEKEADVVVPMKQKLAAVRLDATELTMIDAVTGNVTDPALQKRLAVFTKKSLAFQKLKKMAHWHSCAECGTLCPPDETYCAVCRRILRQETVKDIRRMLLEAPWFTYDELKKYIDCTRFEFDRAKNELISRLAMDYAIQSGQADAVQTTTLAMLIHAKKPEELTAETVNLTLQKIRRKPYVFASRG
ncbi:hypothetical protein P22_1842 [Propionispora sp. 2/2-37]|nr:hypothetical protein P22_1842 [Propionispora sp. 2/2-37]